MTCKDCIHYEECDKYGIEPFDNNDNEKDCCVLYKDKSKFVELPCKLNDLFYIIPTENNGFGEITRVECLGFQISKPEPVVDLFRKESGKSCRLYQAGFDMFNKTIFRSREEAEQKLKE